MDVHGLPPTEIDVARYSVKAGDKIRMAFHYDQRWRPFFWFSVGSDGSVYLGPRYEEVIFLRKGAKESDGSKVRIHYEEGQPVANPDQQAKLSFHASGRIHSFGDLGFSKSFRDISVQVPVCLMLVAHPATYKPIKEPRQRDVCIAWPLKENRPVYLAMFAAPIDRGHLVQQKSATRQTNLLFPFADLVGCQNLLFQVVIAHGAEGEWQSLSHLVWASGRAPSSRPSGS